METEKLKIAFFGTPKYTLPVLEGLRKSKYEIVAVITQPAKAQKRSNQPISSPTKNWALANHIPVFTPTKIDSDFIDNFRKLKINLAVVAAYGLILPEEILQVPKFGFLNIHPSCLPKYRGATPLQAALLNNDEKTCVTIMKIDEKMDHGPILTFKELAIKKNDDINSLLQTGFLEGARLLLDVIPDYICKKITPINQDHSQATFTKLLKKEDGKINWNNSAEYIHNQIRAYASWPGTYCFWNKTKLQIISGGVFSKNDKNKIPGLIQQKEKKIIVQCACGNLELLSIKLAGKKEILSTDFVHGHQDFIGSVLK